MKEMSRNRILAFIMALVLILPFFTPVAYAQEEPVTEVQVEESVEHTSEGVTESLPIEEVSEESLPESVSEEASVEESSEVAPVEEEIEESVEVTEEPAASIEEVPASVEEVEASVDQVETDAVEVVIDPSTLTGDAATSIKEVNVHFGPDASSTRNISWVTVENTEALLQVLDANGNLVYSGKVSGESMDQFYTENDRVWLSQEGPYEDYYRGYWTNPENGHVYYFRTSLGSRADGWQFIDGDWRFFRIGTGTQAFGWQFIDGSWYFLRTEGNVGVKGSRVEGRQFIDGKWYTFNKDGQLQGKR